METNVNHIEVWEMEQDSNPDKAWMKFIARVEKLVGREIDGDEGDGYSIDGAYKAFKKAHTPDAYASNPKRYI